AVATLGSACSHPDFNFLLVWRRNRRWPAWLDSSQPVGAVALNIRGRWAITVLFACVLGWAQNSPQQKVFSAPVSKIQAALKNLPGGTSGPLPVLDGFVV